ncbi:MAG: glycosyltransferase family 39 protein [Ilumatobacteraceae bacterium]|nr:glycosyltransferase family 39 protein [Ilumatobacteraceae bacterium]
MSVTDDLEVASPLRRMTGTTWWRLLRHTLPIYILSRCCVLAGASVVAAELRVDANLADERNLPIADPHGTTNAGSAIRPILDVLTSWDGLWYMDIVRNGYPRTIPPDVTYFVDEARAAFFPLFPLVGRAFDRVLPGGDSLAVLVLNMLLGLIAVVLFALIAEHLYGERVGRTTATLAALFPGSFVLSFAYSEALMLALAAGCLLMLLYQEWTAAGVLAALATATRPNGLALVVACLVAAGFAIHERRDWSSLTAVLLAPVGFITFQVWLGQHTGEPGAWFRVQREAWDEGASFGWTAIRNTVEAIWQPMTSPTDTITALSFLATIVLVVLAWKAKLPWVLHAYSWAIIVLMLVPATVTARPRFVFTAFPLLIGAAKWYDEHRRDRDETLWPMTMAACGAGLAALTGLYGSFGAIP